MNICIKDGRLTIYATWHHSAKLAKIFNKQLVLNKKHAFLFNTSNKMNKTGALFIAKQALYRNEKWAMRYGYESAVVAWFLCGHGDTQAMACSGDGDI